MLIRFSYAVILDLRIPALIRERLPKIFISHGFQSYTTKDELPKRNTLVGLGVHY